jgi:GNAT superfamily N-acetyltransferase
MLKAFILKRLLDNMVHIRASFYFSFEGAICLGFASYQHDYLDDQVTLHKIYLLPEAQGKGGRLLIDAVVAYAKENHSKTLSLNVNRFNKAISFMKTRF